MARKLTGVVTSNKSDKTIVITVSVRKTHPIYKKQYTVSTKYMAHDEKNEANEGDKVVIVETRPISARKAFKLDSIVTRAHGGYVASDAVADVPVEVKPVDATKEEEIAE